MAKQIALKVVAAGEDFAAVLQAQELSKRLAAQLEPDFSVTSGSWKFEALGNPTVRKEAARQAIQADLVIIAASGLSEPPAYIRGWIEHWLPQKPKGMTALVALLEQEDQFQHATSPLCAYLRRVAGQWGTEFFSNSTDWWQQYHKNTRQVAHCQREIPRPGLFAGPVTGHRPARACLP